MLSVGLLLGLFKVVLLWLWNSSLIGLALLNVPCASDGQMLLYLKVVMLCFPPNFLLHIGDNLLKDEY